MISKKLIDRFYQAASIQRWNDHIRPVELTELDKQAHKMVLAYVIGKFEEEKGGAGIDWLKLIEGGIFEFLQRVILTDIKPPVFHKMMEEKGKELNEFVLRKLEKDIAGAGPGFRENFETYLLKTDYSRMEKRILKAAHYLATNWEFRIIYNVSPFIYGIEKTKEEIEGEIEEHYNLTGVQRISLHKKYAGFIDLCGQLRFQQRWAHSPRIPRTSVLGHMLIVAMLTYFCSPELKPCPKRIYNNFFGGLFHDLPEVLTRDIISPVKTSVEGLQEIIKKYEKIQTEERLLPLLPSAWRPEMRYFTEEEFGNKIVENGQVRVLKEALIPERYNQDRYSPLDGCLIKVFDELSAFIETVLSMEYGIKSPALEEARRELFARYRDRKMAGIDVGKIFRAYESA